MHDGYRGITTIRAIIEGKGTFNVVEFYLRLNIIGVGRFSVSVLGEVSRKNSINEKKKNELKNMLRRKSY